MDKLNLKPGTVSPMKPVITMHETERYSEAPSPTKKKKTGGRFLPSNAKKVKILERKKKREEDIKNGLRKLEDPISEVSSVEDYDEMADMFDEMIDLVEEWGGSFFEQDQKDKPKPEDLSPWVPFWDCMSNPKRYDELTDMIQRAKIEGSTKEQ